ncbi:hypothetical protein ACTI_05740 [Actinoplanes sp. OR16]|nr:hypothetical protein [Actinoplanes sp. OR16]BBH63889.1 hypothetical protein ACTI_05740 [Actinoplanes sp. OR16]
MAARVYGFTQRGGELSGQRPGFRGAPAGQQDCELVAAHPGEQRVVRDRARQPLGKGEECAVADRASEFVVDVLEAVQPEQCHLCRPVGHRDAQRALEPTPVRQPGHFVPHGELFHVV